MIRRRETRAASEFPPAYCRNKSMSVASCIHLLVAAAGQKCQPIFESMQSRIQTNGNLNAEMQRTPKSAEKN
jgi:hypothetical protein